MARVEDCNDCFFPCADSRCGISATRCESRFRRRQQCGYSHRIDSASCDALIFLNSDAELMPEGAASLLGLFAETIQWVGWWSCNQAFGRNRLARYRVLCYMSRLESHDTERSLFRPHRRLCHLSTQLLEALQAAHGHMFDPDFCYAEDTDVAARALLLGYRPAYFDGVVAHHEGQVSSGGGFAISSSTTVFATRSGCLSSAFRGRYCCCAVR